MPGERIASQSEVITAIVSVYSPCDLTFLATLLDPLLQIGLLLQGQLGWWGLRVRDGDSRACNIGQGHQCVAIARR